MTPRECWQKRNWGEIKKVPLIQAANRIAANSIIPYPPGIPLLMPGENMGPVVCLTTRPPNLRSE
jgi:arginine decarboxylase